MSGPRSGAGPAARAGLDRASPPAYGPRATRPRTLPLLLLCAGLIVYLVWPFALERAGRAPWRFVSASPAPGEVLAATPAAVTVRLSDALAPNSRLRVERGTLTAVGGRPAYVWEDVPASDAPLDAADPGRRTLTTAIRPRGGSPYYRVSWSAAAPDGRIRRTGTLHFSVGTPLPAELLAASGGVLSDRWLRPRGRRNMRPVAVGMLFVLGLMVVHRRTVPHDLA